MILVVVRVGGVVVIVLYKRITRRVVALVLIAAVALGSTAAPAAAAKVREKPLDRAQVIKRARRWTNARVPYSQAGYRRGYRRDCSGFVSYAWDVPENLVTWRIPYVTKRISQRQLRPGDVLLNYRAPAGARHVVIFERWANRKHTKYYGLEQTGQRGVDRAIRRVLPYPYRIQKDRYKPYRYVGMAGYYRKVPKRLRLPVRGYSGRVTTPQMAEARRRAAAAKATERRKQAVRAKAALQAEKQVRRARAAAKVSAARKTNRLAVRLRTSARFLTGGLVAVFLMPEEPAAALANGGPNRATKTRPESVPPKPVRP